MKNTFKKLTLTLMAAGTHFATSVSASADTTTTKPETTSTTLVNKVTRDTKLATGATTSQPKHDLTPQPTKLVVKSTQNQVLATIDASSQSITKMKYLTNAK
ncbi:MULTISPECIES: hypothetical protein [Lactiplantibacillus]|uniref:Extracellular protein n=1 Tax=Lactiplantibacillus plantarum subsp. plantarum TaxID=337330 RepID=A0A2S3U6P3_LACPN|nr:hypothetical protein [Lactiplantibacillus plantarum]AGE38014.1 Extracellular protein [Lactiplantibacillus plantarum ZJ316]ANI96044.1 hypothetical protein A9F05_10915 [Lactiplantibacillus plantarum]AYG27526.1 hypothetical protein CFI62_05825 [Lactiplantibacillus plantarum]EPD25375.1 Extracellular protein [Lactiplantibacillus plantarum IPLA88]KAF1282378.1 hypothetical protein CHF38_12970 [Lactiplantibacillus plantarum]